jgi:hypothetical protein
VPCLPEPDLRRVLLVRALEEERVALPPAPAAAPGAEARPLSERLAERAAAIAERLPPGTRRMADAALPPILLPGLLVVAAAGAGFASAALGPGGRVHAVVNPVTALLAWNLAVVAVQIGLAARARLRGEVESAPAHRPLLAAGARLGLVLARLSDRAGAWLGARGEARPGAAVRARYGSSYAAAAAPLIAARVAGALGLAAIAFAVFAVAGLYLHGVAWDYRVEWRSTLVPDPDLRAWLARAVFFPAALWLRGDFPDAGMLARMAGPEGAPAAVWFHIFAITCAVYVVIPRALLAAAAWRRAARLARAVPLDAADPYWEAAVRAPAGRAPSLEEQVLARFALDTAGTSLLATLQAGLIEADLAAAPASGWLGGSPLDRKKRWYQEWRGTLEQAFLAFPQRERPAFTTGAALDRAILAVRSGGNPLAPDLVLLELAAFEAYWPLSGEARPRGWWPFGSLSLAEAVRASELAAASSRLGREPRYAGRLREQLLRALRVSSRPWSRALAGAVAGTLVGALTLGIAAPFVAGLVGKALGLAGAAAVKAGLAALGGGAMALGGHGAAGGAAVLVGGGALLGLGVGGGASALASAPRATILVAAAKIEVFLREIALGQHRDPRTFRDVFEQLVRARDRLREGLDAFRLEAGVTASQVHEREASLAGLDATVARCRALGEERGVLASGSTADA